ncbi:hypothetical protein D9M68_921000 [compost metagenome]
MQVGEVYLGLVRRAQFEPLFQVFDQYALPRCQLNRCGVWEGAAESFARLAIDKQHIGIVAQVRAADQVQAFQVVGPCTASGHDIEIRDRPIR